MDLFVIFWWACMAITALVAFSMLSSFGFVEGSDSKGFRFRSILWTKSDVPWSSVGRAGWLTEGLVKRVALRRLESRFASTVHGYVVILRNRPVDRAFFEELQKHVTV